MRRRTINLPAGIGFAMPGGNEGGGGTAGGAPTPTPPAPTDGTPPPANPPAPAAGTGAAPAASGDAAAAQQEIARAEAAAAEKARQAMLAEFGVETADDVKAAIEAKKAADEAANAKKSDEQKRLEQAEKAAAEARAQAAQAAADARQARIRATLAIAGAPAANVPDLARLIDAPDDADDQALTTAVEAVKAKYPALFGGPTGTPPAPSGTVVGGRAQQHPEPDAEKRGRERAKQILATRQGATRDDLISQFSPKTSPLAPTA